MTSRLTKRMTELAEAGRTALVVYLTAGDPDAETSAHAALAAVRGGADVLEIGVPFSDPVADGPVIQRAMKRALDGGGGLGPALEVVRRVRSESDVPIVLFGYLNPLLYRGLEASCEAVAAAGADGLLVVDAPPEEAAPLLAAAKSHNLDWVALVAPTSGTERIKNITALASGFVYVVSMTGVTGGELEGVDHLRSMVATIREHGEHGGLPACVGFGVRNAKGAEMVAGVADGVVVGSAIVAALEDGADDNSGVDRVANLVASLRQGVDKADAS